MTIELKAGQTYRTRNGNFVKIIEDDVTNEKTPGAYLYPFFGDNQHTYTKEGNVLIGQSHDADLVELVSVTALPTRRRLVSITRTVSLNGSHTIDAIDDDGVAWWKSISDSPEKDVDWTRLTPLPDRNSEDAS